MKPSIVQFATPNSQAFFSRLCTRHAMQSALTEPTFLAWKNANVRDKIEKYILIV